MPPVILVTGSSRGLGRGIARHLAGRGYSIAINYARNAPASDETLALCEAGRQTDDQRFLTQAVAQYWLRDKPEPMLSCGFCVIFVTSISAHTASTTRGEYCISKAGLSMAAQLWSARLAGDGIPVYELRPGIMVSDMTKDIHEQYDKLVTEDGLVPQRRWGTGEDLGRAVASLVDGDFPFSTGAIIDIDGGFQIRQLG